MRWNVLSWNGGKWVLLFQDKKLTRDAIQRFIRNGYVVEACWNMDTLLAKY